MNRDDTLANSLMVLCAVAALLVVGVPALRDRPDMAGEPGELPLRRQERFSFGRAALSLPQLPTLQPQVRLIVDLSDRQVFLYRGDRPETAYPIAIGKPGWETPVGRYRVGQMVKDPAWEQPITGDTIPAGENNPLGDRWIGFWTDGKAAIGFHGTADASQMGQALSHGCLRMRNEDVRELFERVEIGTPVEVRP